MSSAASSSCSKVHRSSAHPGAQSPCSTLARRRTKPFAVPHEPSVSGRKVFVSTATYATRTGQSDTTRAEVSGCTALAALALAAGVLFTPVIAEAVSGGGGISTSLAFADLSNQDLRKSRYVKADLRAANFSGSNLQGVSFFGAQCKGANFSGANLSNADLESGLFERADFTNTILEGAQVTNAQFLQLQGNISGSDWTDVNLRKDVQRYLCSIADGTNPVTGVSTKDSLFCE